MSIKLEIPTYLQPFTNDRATIEVKGNTIGQCLDQLAAQFSDIGERLLTPDGELHAYVGIYINGEDAYPDELAKTVKDGDEVHILYVIGGG